MKTVLEIEVLGTIPTHGDYTINPLPVPLIARYDSGPVVIGSRPPETPSLTIKDGSISRRHCTISLISDEWYLEELGTCNGTLIVDDDKHVRLPPHQPINIDGEMTVLLGQVVVKLRVVDVD